MYLCFELLNIITDWLTLYVRVTENYEGHVNVCIFSLLDLYRFLLS